jgi:hypothetical protein
MLTMKLTFAAIAVGLIAFWFCLIAVLKLVI